MFKDKNGKAAILFQKIKANFNNQKQYKIFQSKQFIGILLIVIFSFLFVVSIIQIKGLSTIDSYTVSMFFGYYSYFIYVGFILLGLCYVFQIDIRIEKLIATKYNKKFHFSWFPYLIFALGFALVVESSMQIKKNHDLFPGSIAFRNFFEDWWKNFTNDLGKAPGSSSLLPGIRNSGIIPALFMSLIVSWSGYVVSIIIGLLLISYFCFYTIYGSVIKKIRTKIFGDPIKKDIPKKEIEEYKTKIMDLSFEDKSGIIEKPKYEMAKNISAKTKTIDIKDPDKMFEISNPFEDDEEESERFLKEKTSEVNLEKNLTTEFKLDNIEKKLKVSPDIETFDFELDIFKTETNSLDTEDSITFDKKNKKG